jgi:hypothetical protein
MANTQLGEAREALHQLQIGQGVTSIRKDGRMVEYSAANVADLRQYIKTLELQAGTGSAGKRRPLRFF